MRRHRPRCCAVAVLILATGFGLAGQARPIRIGLARSFLVDQPKGIVDIATDDFKATVKRTIDLDNEINPKLSAAAAAAAVQDKKLDFAILHGHEYAWLQKKHADLRPLVITESKLPLRVCIIVNKKSDAKTLADLRGKTLDMPLGTKEPARVYLAKYCTDKDAKSIDKFFGKIVKSQAPADALNEVARGKVDAAVIDAANLAIYKSERGPVFEKNLRVLAESGPFPPAVIVYKPGVLDQATLDKFKDGLLKANTSSDGREMMKSWNIDGFAPVSKDFDKRLEESLKAYPAPL